MDWVIEIAKLNFGLQGIEAFVDLATNALVEGEDTPSLKVLAGLRKDDPREIRDYLDRTLVELGVKKMSKEETAWILLRYLIDEIIDNKMEPHRGIHSIIHDIYHQMDWSQTSKKYVGDSIGIEKLYGLCDTYDDLLESKYRWSLTKTNKNLLAELELEIYQAVIDYAIGRLKGSETSTLMGRQTSSGSTLLPGR
jgi:hypothetical protein